MKIRKGYCLIVDMGGLEHFTDLTFTDESLCQEMALAFAEEIAEVYRMREVNWNGRMPAEKFVKNVVANAISTYETTIVEE